VVFEVVPAVDVAGGRLARLTRSGPAPLDAFQGDPLAAARAFVEAGAARLHVVDIDRALDTGLTNEDLVRRIAELGAPVQASGGIATEENARRMLDAGADRVVLSSRVLADREAFERILDAIGAAVVAGLELDGARIRPRGAGAGPGAGAGAGAEEVDLDVIETAAWLSQTVAPRYLATDLGRLGQRTGPDLVHIRWLAMRLGRSLLIAGGVSTPDDVRSLASLGPPLEGVVVGSALYRGDLLLEELLEAARS
jgi:phosphoribosylformimino-5-aminoimidazole carboxamide ribonucleotide (ProFAR) isomerase